MGRPRGSSFLFLPWHYLLKSKRGAPVTTGAPLFSVLTVVSLPFSGRRGLGEANYFTAIIY
jgi:hypothetical protein